MIHICYNNDDPILNNHINRLGELVKQLSLNSYEHNKKTGFVWDSWSMELERTTEEMQNDLRKDIDSGDCALHLILENGYLCGFSLTQQWEEVLGIRLVCVDSEYRRRGYGKQLIQSIMSEAKRLGCTNLSVTTEVNNEAALGLYTNFGLKPFSIDLGLQL